MRMDLLFFGQYGPGLTRFEKPRSTPQGASQLAQSRMQSYPKEFQIVGSIAETPKLPQT